MPSTINQHEPTPDGYEQLRDLMYAVEKATLETLRLMSEQIEENKRLLGLVLEKFEGKPHGTQNAHTAKG